MANGMESLSAFAIYSMKRKKVDNAPKVKRLGNKRKNSLGVTSLYKEKKYKSSMPFATVNDNLFKKKKLKEKLKADIIKNDRNVVNFVNDSQKLKVTINKSKSTKDIKTDEVESAKISVKLVKPTKIGNLEKFEKHKKLGNIESFRESNDSNVPLRISQKKSKQIIKKSKKKHNLEQLVPVEEDINVDPLNKSRLCFEWLISPFNIDDFLKNSWEQQPVHIKRKDSDFYKFLMSSPMIDTILREEQLFFTKNVDVTTYTNGMRETHNPPGRALPSIVWDFYENQCSIRMLNPQTFIPQLHDLNAILQEFFGCFVGANAYLTPPNSQGFAPHYDDIEAFILQIEGKKRWRLYKPREGEFLARFSSENFDQSEIGDPIMDTVLNAGDLLYFPRGTIHQGETIDNTHSLHITLSVYQKNSWTDFLEEVLPRALDRASKSDSRFREGLPIGSLRHVGLLHSEDESTNRRAFIEKAKFLLNELLNHVDVDEAADEMAKRHLHDFLPPILRDYELKNSVLQDGWIVRNEGVVEERVDIQPDTRIRLTRSHCVRLVEEGDAIRIYYSTENSKEYHKNEPQFFEIERNQVPVIKEIILQYPNYVEVKALPTSDMDTDTKIGIVRDLWEKCLVVTDGPLLRVE